jgi:hypothetical protein
MADQVYQIDKAGNFSQCEAVVVGMTVNAAEDEVEVRKSSSNIHIPQTKPTKVDAPETISRITDRTVYRTYFRAIGIRNLSVFVLFGLAFAFCIKFPGEDRR